MDNFQGLPTRTIKNMHLSIEYLLSAGPRIVRLSAFGKENLFADIPNKVSTEYGDFFFRGGHRLWHAPEEMPRTYIPDNEGVSVEETPYSVCIKGPPETGTGIVKTIDIRVPPDQPAVTLIHTLQNTNLWPVELAPWALTMFRLGGTVILPQPDGHLEPERLSNNRILALWPYTRIKDPRLFLRDDAILIHAAQNQVPLKIGYFNPHGWSAYWIDGILFRKTYNVSAGNIYPDGGCNCESYCCNDFVELESLGPMVKLKPGESVSLTETWELYPGFDVPFLSDEVREKLTLNPVDY